MSNGMSIDFVFGGHVDLQFTKHIRHSRVSATGQWKSSFSSAAPIQTEDEREKQNDPFRATVVMMAIMETSSMTATTMTSDEARNQQTTSDGSYNSTAHRRQ